MNTQQTEALPAIFVSHGAPFVAIDDTEVHNFLEKLGDVSPKPKGNPCGFGALGDRRAGCEHRKKPETIYDFYGFPEPLYQLKYPAPGAY